MNIVFLAAWRGSVRLLRVMMECGANIFIRQEGITLLDVACASEKLDMIDFLLELGFDPLESGKEFVSPLDRAAQKGHSLSVIHLQDPRIIIRSCIH